MAGDEHAGCSVHVVTSELDAGPVIARAEVRILPRDDPDSLAERVLEAEHAIYPLALEEYARALRDGSLEDADD
jgi:folate-dependent phosphoribosylglycinamide formyltransferase PurN